MSDTKNAVELAKEIIGIGEPIQNWVEIELAQTVLDQAKRIEELERALQEIAEGIQWANDTAIKREINLLRDIARKALLGEK